jgi:hypothetical protein
MRIERKIGRKERRKRRKLTEQQRMLPGAISWNAILLIL